MAREEGGRFPVREREGQERITSFPSSFPFVLPFDHSLLPHLREEELMGLRIAAGSAAATYLFAKLAARVDQGGNKSSPLWDTLSQQDRGFVLIAAAALGFSAQEILEMSRGLK